MPNAVVGFLDIQKNCRRFQIKLFNRLNIGNQNFQRVCCRAFLQINVVAHKTMFLTYSTEFISIKVPFSLNFLFYHITSDIGIIKDYEYQQV